MPAGPAPTMTGGLSAIAVARDDPHALGDKARAGPQPFPIGQGDPAILAGTHQAEPSARSIAKFRGPHASPVGQQRGQHGVAGKRLAGTAVDDETDDRPVALGQAMELRCRHVLTQNMSSSRQLTRSSATTALFGKAMAVATSSARSPGSIISPRETAVTCAVMSVATKLGQIAVARTPSSQPRRRTAWVKAMTANLLIA